MTVTVRSVPDSRIIRISTSASDENIVQPALRSILTAAQREQEKLVDIWDLRVLQAPTTPLEGEHRHEPDPHLDDPAVSAGRARDLDPAAPLRSGPAAGRGGAGPGDGARAEALAAAGWLTREGPRYPTSR